MNTAIVAIVAMVLTTFGVVRGTWAVGGSDSSCYALMAQAMAAGELQPSSALAGEAPWPDASRTLAPGGFIPSPVRPDAASPICAPGMSVVMAPLAAVFGRDAIFWLVPFSGGLLVLSAAAIAQRLAGGMAGAVAAILTATSPIVLYQVVQPMNDVLTAALWIAAFALVIDRASIAGFFLGLAILVRPNLAPVAVVIAAAPFVMMHARPLRSAGIMIAAAAPGIVALLWLNYELYGGPLASGYGDGFQLFAVSNVGDNARNFGRAIMQTQNIVPAIGLLAPVVFTNEKRRASIALLAAAAVVIVIYLLYRPYPEWWYLRFLIPAIVILLVLASAVAVEIASRARMRGLIPLAVVVLALLGVRAAADRQVLELQRLEARYRETALVVADRLPPNAVLITVWQSGSVRFHANRAAIMWDSLEPTWLDRAVRWLRSRGLQPYFLFERREEPEFRARFRDLSEFGALDWPPRIDLSRQVRIYDPADRARYLGGEKYPTENQPRRK